MLVNFVLVLTVLMGCCGLALDIGMLELKTLQLQSAADAAALGAMLQQERGDTNWQAAGQAEAAQNGFTNGAGNTSVTITNAPTGFYANDYSAVQAVVSQKQLPLFMSALKVGALTPVAQAIAQAPPCVYMMGNSPGYFSLQTASNGFSGNCPMYIRNSLENDGFAQTHMSAIRISGPASASTLQGTYTPTPYFNVPPLSDPLAWVTAPTSPGSGNCTHSNTSITVPTTLGSGTYCGGLNITGTTVTLNPGLYIIAGGINWKNATVTGSGVTLYMTALAGTTTYGQFLIQQNSVINLSAPNDNSAGGIPGILVFADRNWVQTSQRDFHLDTCSFAGDGIWYMLNAGFYDWSTNMLPTNYLGIVAQSMYTFGATIHVASNYSSLRAGTPFHPRGTLVQ